MNNDTQIVLLEIGAEGGGLKLVLEMTDIGIFSYRLIENSSEHLMFDDKDFTTDKPIVPDRHEFNKPLVIDWNGALSLMDKHRWPWPLFYPSFVHPCIQAHLLSALKERYSRYPDISFADWERDFHLL